MAHIPGSRSYQVTWAEMSATVGAETVALPGQIVLLERNRPVPPLSSL